MPNEYTKRLNITFDYIEKHLDKPFTLEELAAVASFSKYHFTRIFCSLTGETPFQYITRIRMEKAAFMMIANPEMSITDIALNYGYNDLTVFSRNFKKYFLMIPTQFRESKRQYRNLSRTHSNSGQADEAARMYFCP